MALIDADHLDQDALAYKIFGITRDKTPWRVSEVLHEGDFSQDGDRRHLAWQVASRGYYAEQAGLTAAATLAAATEDAPLRFSLALAAADEARHADAFYQYAKAVAGQPDECRGELAPLDDALVKLPHLGRALVHTMLEGFAADEFILLGELFAGDPLARLYHHVRRDEVRHVAIGLNYLARSCQTLAAQEIWRDGVAEWHAIGLDLTGVEEMAVWLGGLLARDPDSLKIWFLRRHHARLKAAGVAGVSAPST